MEPLLTEVEARIVGCLLEKQRTVPDTYPLTLNSLLTACNQSSNRDPVVRYDDRSVLGALDDLKGRGLTRIVHSPSNRAAKYRHVLDEALGLDDPSLALVAVLLLRGPQTAAELRTRTERLHPFDSLTAVEAALDALAARDEPLVRRLERRPGERETRWLELLSDRSGHDFVRTPDETVTRTPAPDRVDALEARVAELESVVAELRTLLD